MRRMYGLGLSIGSCALLLSAVDTSIAERSQRPNRDGVIASGEQQKQGTKSTSSRQKNRATPKPGASSSLRAHEQRLARKHIVAAFPRTRNLISYLDRQDPAALGVLLAHSRKITRRLESAALGMARQHHPELARLVQRLRRSYPRAYDTALRDLVSDHQRIQRAEGRGRVSYQQALTEWKLRSQARLIAARMTVQNQPQLSQQLAAILAQSETSKRRQIQMEIERYRQQIESLRHRLRQNPAAAVASQMKKIQRRVQARAKNQSRSRK